jgi:transcriptional regulator with XRE-family HTH domain
MLVPDTNLTPALCRAARGLLGWSQEELATTAMVGRSTVNDFEREARVPMRSNLRAIRQAFEDAGLRFMSEGQGGVYLAEEVPSHIR